MDSFNARQYVEFLGKSLVHEFDMAKMATQTVAIGSNKENSVITKLQNILPPGVGIGSGFVFDSWGNVSGQCDIILYENEFALKCCINDNDDAAFSMMLDISGKQIVHVDLERHLRLQRADMMAKIEGSFSDFIYQLLNFINNGKSVPIDYAPYLKKNSGSNNFLEIIPIS